ncbi:Hypothetical predicted protein [Octopus vulgaris]|uniref:Uncharacterized protein n=1 Tax=Octopus vulgaris TaxID=6645 RepID=A0AA36ASM4_OCTVU|nr:Hypothetical predicted protein [Octopus vulgaris]
MMSATKYNLFRPKPPAKTDVEGGQKASYNIALNIAKDSKSYSIGEEVIIPALVEVIENVMKANPDTVLKWCGGGSGDSGGFFFWALGSHCLLHCSFWFALAVIYQARKDETRLLRD